MESVTRLDRVFPFDGMLSFLIPSEWAEETEDDHYLYARPGTDSGWLRVSLITIRSVSETLSRSLERAFDGREQVIVEERTGNLVRASEKDSGEAGIDIHLYYWKVAQVLPPDLICKAIFSYTVLRERINEEETRQTVKLIARLASQARFSRSD